MKRCSGHTTLLEAFQSPPSQLLVWQESPNQGGLEAQKWLCDDR